MKKLLATLAIGVLGYGTLSCSDDTTGADDDDSGALGKTHARDPSWPGRR